MSSIASKKRMGARTSQQVAAPIKHTLVPVSEPSVLETSSTLPYQCVLPISESAFSQVSSRVIRFAAMNQEPGSQWGIPEADPLLDSVEDCRMTRAGTKLPRAGAFTPALDDLVYRGHDWMRVKNSREAKQTDAETLASDGEPAALCAGAPVVETSLPGGEPAASSTGAPTRKMHAGGEPAVHSAGAPVLDIPSLGGEPAACSSTGAPTQMMHADGEPAAPCAGAPIVVNNSQPHGEPAAPSAGAPVVENLRSEAETAARATRSRPEGQGTTLPDEWKVAVMGPSMWNPSPTVPSVAARHFPSWFDLLEDSDEDPYGPLPRDWLRSSSSICPVLPDIRMESSFSNDFWSAIDSDSGDEECDLQYAIKASITMTVEECEKLEWQHGLSVMALIVDIDSDNEDPEPLEIVDSDDEVLLEAPASQDGKYPPKQKRKGAPRTKDQREFLRCYVSRARGKRDRTKSVPPSGKSKRKAPQGPAQFKREPSLVPEGGWFRASTAAGGRGPPHGPPSSYSSSEPDSSSSDRSSDHGYLSSSSARFSRSSSPSNHGHRGKTPSERRHREKQKRETKRIRKALAGVKIKPPFPWDGTPDLDLFDQWTYEVDTWRELYGLSDKLSIRLVVQFLTGTAGRFFMKHVATCQPEWNMASLYEALFDYCFPTDYKAQLRLRLERAVQGRTKVRDFVREIQHLAARFPDVSDFQLAQIFWRGVHGYIRVYLIEKGLHPEHTPLDKMVKYAARHEEAYIEARHLDEHTFEGRVAGRTWNLKFAEGSSELEDEPDEPASEKYDWRKHHPEQHENYEQGSQSEKLSKEQRDQLYAEGRCFTCGEKGHISRNCSVRMTARGPDVGISASSIRFENLENLAERARQADGVSIAAIRLDLPESQKAQQVTVGQKHLVPEERSENEGIWARAHTADCIEYLLTMLVSYFNPEDARDADLEPDERFTVRTITGEPTDSEFLIIDHLAPEESPDEFIVSRTQMDDPGWGIPNMLQEAWNEYASLPPRAEWGQGFPSRGVSDKWYPACISLKDKLTYSASHQDYPSPLDPKYELQIESTSGFWDKFGGRGGVYGGRGSKHYHGGRGGGCGGYIGCSRYTGRSGGFGGYENGHATPMAARIEAPAPKKKLRHRKYGNGAQVAFMDDCLMDIDSDDEPEAGPSGQTHWDDSDSDSIELPDEDSGPGIVGGEEPEDNRISNSS